MSESDFKLGSICVSVFTKDGEKHIEDWAYLDRGEARIYACQTSSCDDVLRVEFENRPQKIFEVYVDGELSTSAAETVEKAGSQIVPAWPLSLFL